MVYTLHTYPGNSRAEKALIAAEYGNVKIEVSKNFEFGKTNKTPEFLAKHPAGKVLLLETPEGPVFESNAIARYVAKLSPQSNLLGKCFYSQSRVDMWVDFITLEVESVASQWYYPLMGYGNQDPKAVASAKAATLQKLSLLDAHLATNTFFVGNYVTLADIVGYAVLSSLYKLVLTSKHRSEYPRLTRWFTTVVNQPQFKKVIGEFKFAETEKTLGGAEEKASDSKKEKKPAAAKKAPEPEPVGDDEDVPQPKKEKAKNPLDDLPKSNMVLDNVKRLFSNEPFASAAPKFWEEYDHEGYSVWECAYNYNSENKIFFMTCNLVGGYIQRLDPLRKYGYAALNVIGASEEQGPFDVCGIFLVRGTEMPAELKNCDDSEYYTWSRIDVTSDKGEARFAELWNSETINGKSLLERRWFK